MGLFSGDPPPGGVFKLASHDLILQKRCVSAEQYSKIERVVYMFNYVTRTLRLSRIIRVGHSTIGHGDLDQNTYFKQETCDRVQHMYLCGTLLTESE